MNKTGSEDADTSDDETRGEKRVCNKRTIFVSKFNTGKKFLHFLVGECMYLISARELPEVMFE